MLPLLHLPVTVPYASKKKHARGLFADVEDLFNAKNGDIFA
jgi:hypothetical protein